MFFFENLLDDYYSACTNQQLPYFKFMFEEIFFLKFLSMSPLVTEVWFLKKKDKGDGFEEFNYDYKT